MAPIRLFCFLLLNQFMQILLAETGNCPASFNCGILGQIQFPFTTTEYPYCGLFAIQGCLDHDRLPTIKFNDKGRYFPITVLSETTILIRDPYLNNLPQNGTCEAFKNNYTLPFTSPFASFIVKNIVTFSRCSKKLNVSLAHGSFRYRCDEYDIYFGHQTQIYPSGCSVIELPTKDTPDNRDPSSFVASDILIEVKVSQVCSECYYRRRGQCKVDNNGNFHCSKEDRSRALKLRLGLGIGLSLVGILIIGLLIGWKYKREYGYGDADQESDRIYFGVPIFSYKELQQATKNFACSRVLGDGGFGTVYYGKLQDGREVAVKRLYEHKYRQVERFMNEIKILTRLRHKNLVSLYGSTSCHSRELLLVYEYIPNGTLAFHLRGDSASPFILPWSIRIKIAIETAIALTYLHASDIIHRDVKTNNILLDNEFCVKVADFGLSRLFPTDVTHVSTAPQGTPGYVDPEYHRCYQLTSKSDVYSFGVVLIELISSMAAVDMSRKMDEINLADLAMKKIQKNALRDLVDPSLGFESDNDVNRKIILVAELAFRCLQREKELRPSMDEVLEMLIRIESGKEEFGDLKDVNLNELTSASPDRDEMRLLKNVIHWKLPSSPNISTDKWESACSTSDVSA